MLPLFPRFNLHKWMDPKAARNWLLTTPSAKSGAVIPIVHMSGFNISERTIYRVMDDKEMAALFYILLIWLDICHILDQ